MQDHGYPAFGVCHTGAVSAIAIDPERSLGSGARTEHSVVVNHQQEGFRAVALDRADNVVARRRAGRRGFNSRTQRLETFDQYCADGLEPCGLARTGVDVHQLLDGRQIRLLVGFGFLQQLFGRQLGGQGQ